MRKIEVVPHEPAWAADYEAEARQVVGALGAVVVAIHHIGSTAIPGLPAKPIIDIMLEVRDLARLDELSPAMAALGYEPRGERGIPGRRYFVRRAGDQHTHHVHAYRVGADEVARQLAFRDYLRAHPQAARAYAELKQRLAEQFPMDSASYTNGKTDLVMELSRRAAAWRREREEDDNGL